MGLHERPRIGARGAWLERAATSGGRRAALALVLMSCACLALPGVAAATSTATIEGTVTQAEAPKGTIEGLCVEARSSSDEVEGGFAITEADGKYTMREVPAGSYKVKFYDCSGTPGLNYAPRYWDEATTSASATALTLTAGETRTGIDAQMENGAEIYGTLFNEKAVALSGTVCVFAIPVGSEEGGAFTTSNDEGEYTLEGLATGSYVLQFSACGADVLSAYLGETGPEFRTSEFDSATRVNVTAEEPAPVAPVEVAAVRLEAGAEIQGAITESAGNLVKQPMCVYARSTSSDDSEFSGTAETSDGDYVIAGLETGSYDVYVEECAEPGLPKTWATQYFNGVSEPADATPVSVTAGLEPPAPATANFKVIRASAVKPVNTAAPAISGTTAVGQALMCSTGTWSGTPSPAYSYQWLRDGAAITGATSSSYVVQSADEAHGLACSVTATNEAGSASATSATVEVAKVVPPPAPKPGTAVAAGGASVDAGVADVRLSCTGEGACKGSLELVVKLTVKSGKHHKRRLKTVIIGKASFSIAAKGSATIEVHLSGKGKSLLAKAGKHGLSVHLSGAGVTSRTVLLKLVKSGHSKPKKQKH